MNNEQDFNLDIFGINESNKRDILSYSKMESISDLNMNSVLHDKKSVSDLVKTIDKFDYVLRNKHLMSVNLLHYDPKMLNTADKLESCKF